jgi:hypothetical protein
MKVMMLALIVVDAMVVQKVDMTDLRKADSMADCLEWTLE